MPREVVIMRLTRLVGVGTLGLAFFFPMACTNGPDLIVRTHIYYNKAVRQVMNEEQLRNIVRMRYAEAPQFVSVSSINTNFETTSSGTGNVGWTDGVQGPATWGLEGSLAFRDNPTISITPRQGEEVAKQLLGSIDPTNIAYLSGAGYRLDHIFALLVESVNGVRNYTAAGTLPARGGDPEYGDFLVALHSLEENNDIMCGFLKAYDDYDGAVSQDKLDPSDFLAAVQSGKRWRPLDDDPEVWALHTYALEPVIWISPEGQQSEAGKTIIDLFNLDTTQPFFWLSDLKFEQRPTTPTDSVRVRMRSFYGVMNLLSLAVQLPMRDAQGQRALPVLDPSSHPIMVQDFLDVAFHVHEAVDPPKDAWVAVRSRNCWFFIDDRELASKRTFTLVVELLNLQMSRNDSGNAAPILTIPVG